MKAWTGRGAFAWVAAGAAALVAGCGGSSPSARSPGSEPTASLPDPTPPPPAAKDSPEVQAGLKAFDAGNFADARRSFEAATKKYPSDYGAFVNLGQACEKLGDVPAAEAAYKGALAAQPDLEVVAAELSTLYAADGNVDDALSVAKGGLDKHPNSGPLHASLAIALAKKGDRDAAVAEFDRAVQLQPSDPMLQYTYASFLNQWHTPGASPHLEAALGLVKDDYAMIVSIGHEYRMASDFSGCANAFDRAIRLKDAGEARTERALCKLGQKDEPGALADLQAAVAVDPGYAPGHYYLGGRLATTKHYKEAAAEFQKVLDLAPSGSLAKAATDKLKLAQEAAARDKTPKKK